MTQNVITWVSPLELKEGTVASNLYSIPENYETIKENIKKVGILTPLHVVDNVVVSGNLRLRIAKELKMDLVPVLYVEPKHNLSEEVLAVSYSQQRKKKYSELLREYEILEEAFPVGKGKRTDLNPEAKANREKRKELNVSKDKIVKLKSIKKLSKELYGDGSEDYEKVWKEVDEGKTSLNRLLKGLKREQALRENNLVLPEHFEIDSEHAKVYNKSCENMQELEDNSIACIITSPPYFQMVDYGTGDAQRGMERDIEDYIEGLLDDFADCKRVLKDDGSLWVNINEPVVNGEYHQISQMFAMRMRQNGWKLNDEIIWVKNNPQFTQAKRSVRSHEYIFHFVKSKDYFYDISWLSNLQDSENIISMGTSGKVSNLISGMDPNGISVIRTNGNNMNDLREACKKSGFNLTHSAGYPITIPLIPILTTSKVGDTVLDIFSGTGTTGESALATKRKYIGYEIKPEFIKSTEVRLDSYLNPDINQAA